MWGSTLHTPPPPRRKYAIDIYDYSINRHNNILLTIEKSKIDNGTSNQSVYSKILCQGRYFNLINNHGLKCKTKYRALRDYRPPLK